MTETETPSWGIEPVPERLRVLGTFDGFLLWANLSVSLLVIVAGAFLVLPADQFGLALSLPDALAAIVAAAVVGNVLLGLGGLIGADARVPNMVLLRAPLGRRGSYLPTGLNILQCLGWSVFELIIIATGASALSKQVLGFGGVSFWKIAFGIVAMALALLGPVGFVRKYVRKFAVWVVIASLLYISWWSLHGQHPVQLWQRGGCARLLARLRSRARVGDQLDAARRRLHALLAHPGGRLLERRARVLRADDPAVRTRRGDRAVPHRSATHRPSSPQSPRAARRACWPCSR